MKLMYIAFGASIHTLKWIEYFKKENDILLISFYKTNPIDCVRIEYLPVTNKNLVFFKLGEIKKLIEDFEPDIVHAHFATSCGLLAALSGFHPFVLSVWGDDILKFPFRSPLHKWVVRKSINCADRVTATSGMLEKSTIELIGRKKDIQVIPFGVDLGHYHYIKRANKDIIRIGTVRNLTPKYGIEYLIRATAACIGKSYDCRLTIVGDGIIRQDLEKLVKDLKLDEYVTFTGAVPNEKVVEYLNEFDIFVMPSVEEGETFGVAAVEAMATGLPVIASKIGGLPEVVDDGITGTLIKPGDVEDLTKALIKYIESEELRRTHGTNGRAKVEREYNWLDNAKMMSNLYDSLLAQEW